jgi:hypothetical protein
VLDAWFATFVPLQLNGSAVSRANRTRDGSTYAEHAAVGVGCTAELGGRHRS